jgi:hypothetical protein
MKSSHKLHELIKPKRTNIYLSKLRRNRRMMVMKEEKRRNKKLRQLIIRMITYVVAQKMLMRK